MLICENSTISDLDNDSINLVYDWYNGSAWTGINSRTLQPGNVSYNSLWNCSVTAVDSYTNSTKISSAVRVNNTAPNITYHYPDHERINISETGYAYFNVSYNDSDSVSVIWKLNSTVKSSSDSYNYTPDYGSSGIYNLTVIVNDSSLVDSVSWIINVSDVNRKPVNSTIPDIRMYQDSNSSINLSYYFSDPDNDTLNFSAINNTNLTYLINYSNSNITLIPLENWTGTTYIVINATDTKTGPYQITLL